MTEKAYRKERYWLSFAAILTAPFANAQVWTLTETSDPFTDEQSVSVRAVVGDVNIVVRCMDNRLETYVNVDDFLGDDRLDVRYRFDSLQAQEEQWYPSADGTAVFANNDSDVARRLMAASRFAFEVRDFRGVPHQAVGDLPSDSSGLESVLNACNAVIVSPSEIDPSIPENVITDIDRWGPQNVTVNKQILQALGRYNGPIDAEKNIELYRATADHYSEFIDSCAIERDDEPVLCFQVRLLGEDGAPPLSPTIYESAPTEELRSRAGSLRIGD